MIDRYTKAVLTVIAACLAVIAVRGLQPISAVYAQTPVHVIVDQFLYQLPGSAIKVTCENCK